MQIKRFEAADMTEALRLVKREFGDDAVILSAKEVRPGGFFSALRKKSVEITAATDYPVKEGGQNNDFSGLLSTHLNTDMETDRVSLSTPPAPAMHAARRFRSISSRQTTSEAQHPPVDRNASIPAQGAKSQDLTSDTETTRAGGAGAGSMADAFSNAPSDPPIAEPFYRHPAAQTVIALVGPCGAGKTTTVAKLAWHCQVVEKKRTGLISLDRFRIGANAMLAKMACIMDLPLRVVHDAEQLQSALGDLTDADVILIDTPGISGNDTSIMSEVCSLLRIAEADETHLVANATVRDGVFEACVAAYAPLGVNRLLLTHMDEHTGEAAGLNRLKKCGLPASFFSDGADLTDGFHEYATAGAADRPSLCAPGGGPLTLFSRQRGQIASGSGYSEATGDSVRYVANRNSELFHHPACKSVKRINAENITAFNSIEQAMDEGFKPCRACCDISMIRKPVSEGFGHQRARAM
ncbi:Ada metal-binding domain-containing protein [Desulfosarcina sp.]|uniref:Ada metal-binding domain-containing protein n=1 Tax=Desulfosarcina sp. TaxID=2027861 RepID=UPI003568467D